MSRPMPAAFLGHGSPMNALETNRYTEAWRALGASVPRPRAILVVSAHWFVTVSAVTAMARPRMIHVRPRGNGGSAAELPDPARVPPEDTNL
jgi:4,5-DOPA dioxygenase extradiol